MADQTIQQVKTCTKCGSVKPLSEYYANPKLSDGRYTACMECVKTRQRKWKPTQEQRERANARLRAFRKTPEGKEYARRYAQENRERIRINIREWTRRRFGYKPRSRMTPEQEAISRRNSTLKRKYKITYDDYKALLVKQGGVCAVCDGPPNGTGNRSLLAVDHDHQTGRVRALLCHKCNAGMGLLNDDPQLLQRAREYLLSY